MARLLVRASSQFLAVTPATMPITTTPFTMGIWFNAVAFASNLNLFNTNGGTNATQMWAIRAGLAGALTGYVATAGNNQFNATTTFTTGTWNHACFVLTSSTARAIYLNGGGKTSDTTSRAISAPTTIHIGSGGDGGLQYFDGHVAEAAIWNIALSDAEVALIGTTAIALSPLLMHPESLVFYAPLLAGASPEMELMGGDNMTVTGATVSTHPPVKYPSTSSKLKWSAAAVAADTIFAQAIM